MKFPFALAAILVLVSSGMASACPACPDGMKQVDVNLEVSGKYCSWDSFTDTAKFNMAQAGTYDVYGYVVRGYDGWHVCEMNEEFYISTGGTNGPVSLDGTCDSGETLLPLGTFDLNSGKNTVTMTSSFECGMRHKVKNDVQVLRLCIAETPPSAPEFPVQALALVAFAAIPGAALVARKK